MDSLSMVRQSKVTKQSVAKLAAGSMRNYILSNGLRPGTRLGSLEEWTERLGVSRGSAREAIRLLESQGLIQVKTGPNGGIFVSSPDVEAVTQAASDYLHFEGMTVPMLYETRKLLESQAARLAAERIDDNGRRLLQEHVEREEAALKSLGGDGDVPTGYREYRRDSLGFHSLVVRLTANVALILFADMLIDLTALYVGRIIWEQVSLQENFNAHVRIAEAIRAGDGDLAQIRMWKHIAATEERVRSRYQLDQGS